MKQFFSLYSVVALVVCSFACSNETNLGDRDADGGAPGTADASATDGAALESTVEKEWTGQPIDIRSDGAQVSVEGGVEISVDEAATRVSATAEFRGPLPKVSDDGGSVQQTPSSDPPGTLTIAEEAGTLVVRCRNAQSAGDGGCNKLKVVVPPGTSAKPLVLSVSLENGTVWVSGRGAVLGSLSINTNGDVDATVPATKDASISVISKKSGDITLKLPATFAADSIVLEADAEKIDTSDFPDVTSGAGRGTTGSGAKLISLTSAEFAGSTGAISLKKD